MSSLCVDSILINGRGQYRNYQDESDALASVRQVFEISSDGVVTLNLIHGGFEFAVRIFRLDFGEMTVVETDGQPVEPTIVNEIILGIGETYVIRFDTDSIESNEIFWDRLTVRAQIIGDCLGQDCRPVRPIYADIFLENSGSPDSEPIEKFELAKPHEDLIHLTPMADYTTLNCFWPNNNEQPKRTCISSHELKNTLVQSNDHYEPIFGEIPDRILNFTFNFATGASINNRRFEYGEPMHQGRIKLNLELIKQ